MIKELIVKIKTIFEGDGGQSVIQPAKELTAQTDKLVKETDKLKNGTSDASKAARKLAQEQAQQIRIAQNLTAASMGSREGFAGLARELTKTGADGEKSLTGLQRAMSSFSATVSKASLYAASFFAGWKVGSAIFSGIVEPIWDGIAATFRKTEQPLAKTQATFEKLNQVKLDGLNTSLADTTEKISALITELDLAIERSKALWEAQTDLEIAKIKRDTPEGPEREAKIAALRGKSSEAVVTAEIGVYEEKKALLEKQISALLQSINAVQPELKEAYLKYNEVSKPLLEKAKKGKFSDDENNAYRNQRSDLYAWAVDRNPIIPQFAADYAKQQYQPFLKRYDLPAKEGSLTEKELLPVKEARNRLAASQIFEPDLDKWVAELDKVKSSLADVSTKLSVAQRKKETISIETSTSLSEIEQERQKEEARKASEAAAEKRRVERAQLEARLAGTRPSEATGISRRLAELDEADISAAAADSPAKQAVLEQDKAMARAQREKDLRATLEPQYEKLKSTRDSAINEGLEAAGARERMRENPRDKGAKDTYEKESKEAQKAQAEFEKAMRAFTNSHEATMGEIVKFLQQAEQKNKQTKDKISRLPI